MANPRIPTQNEPFLRDGRVSVPWWRFLENIKYVITNNANLDAIGNLADASGFLRNNGLGAFSYTFPTKSEVGLGNVTNATQLVASNNLSDLTNVTTARTNLGLSQGATVSNVGTSPPANGVIAGLTFSSPPTQAECIALRNQCEILRDSLAAAIFTIETLRDRFTVTFGNGLIAD